MATFLTANQATTYTLTAEEDLVLAQGVTLTSNGSGIAVATGDNSGHILSVLGQVLANNTGLNLGRNGNSLPYNNAVSVGASGVVQSLNGDGMFTNSNLIRVTNHGLIETVSTSTSSQGLDLFANTVIVNAGTISSFASDGIRVSPTSFFDSTGPQHLDNSGLISAGANGLNYAGMWLFGTNSGIITGGNIGVVVTGTGSMTFTNTGRIDGRSGTAVLTASKGDQLQNSGTINGSVQLGDGEDLYVGQGAGVVNGLVQGQGGNDTLAGGSANDAFDGGDGDDLLTGSLGDDYLTGQLGRDLIRGGDGDDQALGGDAQDTLRGGAGEDTLDGGLGNDILAGGAGDDLLNGGGTNDTLQGGLGQDTLIGGTAVDRLTGGGDADVFVFRAPDSGLGVLKDVITDFTSGVDLVDLGDVVPGTLLFMGYGDFVELPAAQVRLVDVFDGTLVEIDFDGATIADMQILLLGASGLQARDFIL